MLETNHVRAALLKSLPLFLIITQIIYKCNRNTHTHLLAGQSMCWDNDKKVQRRKRACCFAQTNPYQQTNLEGRGKACAMTRKWNRQRYILLWQPFQLKNKQNRTGHKLYANWYNQRINATVNIIWHHTRKCTSQEEKQKDAPTPPSEARRPRTPTSWILSNSINTSQCNSHRIMRSWRNRIPWLLCYYGPFGNRAQEGNQWPCFQDHNLLRC